MIRPLTERAAPLAIHFQSVISSEAILLQLIHMHGAGSTRTAHFTIPTRLPHYNNTQIYTELVTHLLQVQATRSEGRKATSLLQQKAYSPDIFRPVSYKGSHIDVSSFTLISHAFCLPACRLWSNRGAWVN